MCIEMCIGLILEHVEMALLLVSWLVVLFPSSLQNSPNVFIPLSFSKPYVTALVILLQGVHTADGATW
ncbi:hypothetical protein GIB53_21570 [Escherichia coli]|nr:hypothetical protein [Escherichia coli]